MILSVARDGSFYSALVDGQGRYTDYLVNGPFRPSDWSLKIGAEPGSRLDIHSYREYRSVLRP